MAWLSVVLFALGGCLTGGGSDPARFDGAAGAGGIGGAGGAGAAGGAGGFGGEGGVGGEGGDGRGVPEMGAADFNIDAGPADAIVDAMPPDAGPAGRQIKVATFNVERLFDTVCDSGTCGPDEYEPLPSRTDFLRKVEDVARAILALDADVVMLEEIENQASLEAVIDLLETLGSPYPVAVLGAAGQLGSVNVAVISRGRLVRATRHRDSADLRRPADNSRTTFSREFLEVESDFDGERVVAFAAHFRSKYNDDPGRRQAEARAARDIVRASAAANRNALVVMAGDLNDTPDSPPLQDLMAGGHLLRVAEELGDQDYTYNYLGELIAIDHVLLATEAAGAGYLPGTATIFRGRTTTGFGGSDHAAVRATFLFPEP